MQNETPDTETVFSNPSTTDSTRTGGKKPETTTDDEPATERTPPRKFRGFAAMDSATRREISSKGGKAAHQQGTAHQFSSDEARVAGRKGGLAPHVVRGRGRRKTST